jgi:tRNA nucleotidyltransferase (CCA-adding enzyme)
VTEPDDALTPALARDRILALRPPPGVVEIADRLERAGFETWCVGGAVRDAVLRHPTLDWDLATAAPPRTVQQLFRRTVPKGIEFGTVGVFDRQGVMHEVTTFRRDVRTDGRHAVVEFGASLDEDLARRDFSINAIAFSVTRGLLHDPFDGVGDLGRRVVRAVGDPPTRLREDRLRALRAIRFAGRFDFDIDAATWAAIVESAPHLGRLSPERVREELDKTMRQVACPSAALERWRASGALDVLVPALAAQPATAFAAADHLARPGLARRPQRQWNRMAAPWLGLDRGTVERGLRALRCSNQEVRWIADLAERWQRLGDRLRQLLSGEASPPDAAVRRWVADAGRTLTPALLRLAAARFAAERAAGQGAAPGAARVRALYRRAVRIAYRDPIATGDLAVDGGELADAGVPPGPRLGRILQALLDVVVDDPALNTREALLARVPALLAEGAAGAPTPDPRP